MVSYCSLSNDRSLTNNLIESSTKSSKCIHRFVNTPEWADGLDIWSSSLIIKKTDLSKRNIDFHEDIGIYFPRFDKDHSTSIKNDLNSPKLTTNNLLPERLKQLFNRQKLLLKEIDLNISLSDDQLSIKSEDNQQSKSTETTITKVRYPLRQVQSNNSSRESIRKQNVELYNKERFKSLLKEQLNDLFTRETNNINQKRTTIRIPQIQIKHENIPPRTIQSSDPTLIMERYSKLQQLLISPPLSQPTINSKIIHLHQSPLYFQGTSTLGLTVTPLDFASSKNFQNSSLEQISQLETTNRPITQPGYTFFYLNKNKICKIVPTSMNPSDEQQRIQLRRSLETDFTSSPRHFIVSNVNSIDEQTQNIRKIHRHHRSSSSKNNLQTPKPLQLLPTVLAGKRLHIPISNQRHS